MTCHQMELRGSFDLHEIESIVLQATVQLGRLGSLKEKGTLIARFGTPLLIPVTSGENPPALAVGSALPQSWVLKDEQVYPEARWTVFGGETRWVFPEHLSVVEAPWA